jgi:hypothetical protein
MDYLLTYLMIISEGPRPFGSLFIARGSRAVRDSFLRSCVNYSFQEPAIAEAVLPLSRVQSTFNF